MVTAVVRDQQTAAPLPDMVLQANDIVLLQGEPAALERAVAGSDLELEGENRTLAPRRSQRTRSASSKR